MKRSIRSYLINGVLRLALKRRMPVDLDIPKTRAMLERLDKKYVKAGSGVVRTEIDTDGVRTERIAVPNSHPERIILYLHGGGFVLRTPNLHTRMVANWCRVLGSTAFMPDYRLAPEHPFPAAPDDCFQAYRWLLDEGHAPENIVIAGDSAGGCLTLTTLHQISAANLPMPVGAVLLSPAADLTMSGESGILNERKDPMFTLQVLLLMRNAYARELVLCEPKASPLFADFDKFPPLKILCGSTEILLSDSIRVAEKARAAGVPVEFDVSPGMPHVYPVLATLPESMAANQDIVHFIAKRANW